MKRAERKSHLSGNSRHERDWTRRALVLELVIGGLALLLVLLVLGWLWLRRAMQPLPEPVLEFRAGTLREFQRRGLYTQFKEPYGVWIAHQPDGTLVALSAICTHLGCTPDWVREEQRFVCPCHGSAYDPQGVNVSGPTERPLERFAILRRGDEIYVDKAETFRQELGEWTDPRSFIDVGRD